MAKRSSWTKVIDRWPPEIRTPSASDGPLCEASARIWDHSLALVVVGIDDCSCYGNVVSPTVFIYRGYRFFFFSREEKRMHVHVHCSGGEAKFWLEPKIELAKNVGLSSRQILAIQTVIKERKDEIAEAWQKHFIG
jgi:hypothetical protein